MKRHTVLASFDDADRIDAIIERDPRATRLYANRDRALLYIETPRERFISAERWATPAKPCSVRELIDFMRAAGPDYNYTSPASFAFSFWRKNYAPHENGREVFVMQNDGRRAVHCRRALYGGRCEVYRYGEHYLHKYDINSSYPYASTQLTFPHPHSVVYSSPGTIDNIWRYEGASKVSFTQTGNFPVLPFHYGDRLIYPQGEKLIGYYTHTELRYAMECGVQIHQIAGQYIGRKTIDNPFAAFVEYCYNKRADNPIWKSIVNALFGRLSILGDDNLWVFRGTNGMSRREFRALPVETRGAFGDTLCVGEPSSAPTDSNPLWAAMVLSAARNRLHSLTNTETYYVDTDCIMCSREQYLPLSTALGGLKYESGIYKLAGTKAYGKREGNTYQVKLRGVSTAHRSEADLHAARFTNERIITKDGWTVPHSL